jgi:hypothetical protein
MSAPDWQRLIFAGRQVEDVRLPPPDEHRLIFSGKQLEDTLKARGRYVSPPA